MSGINQLNLNKCMVNEWNSVEALAEITTLRDLRISRIPLLAGLSDEEKIHLVVARMPLLEVLNGSPITKEQREKSERFFIRQDYCFHVKVFLKHVLFEVKHMKIKLHDVAAVLLSDIMISVR